MPNEPVECPNCGSGDVHQLAAESYACEHCHTNFRWVKPVKEAVVRQPIVCACGRIAVAFCTRCGAALCKTHSEELDSPCLWGKLSKKWKDLLPINSLSRDSDRVWGILSNYGDYNGVIRFIKENRIPENRGAVLCQRCHEECSEAIDAFYHKLEGLFEKLKACEKQLTWGVERYATLPERRQFHLHHGKIRSHKVLEALAGGELGAEERYSFWRCCWSGLMRGGIFSIGLFMLGIMLSLFGSPRVGGTLRHTALFAWAVPLTFRVILFFKGGDPEVARQRREYEAACAAARKAAEPVKAAEDQRLRREIRELEDQIKALIGEKRGSVAEN